LPGLLIELPGSAAKQARPVIGRATARRWIAPDVPVTFLVCPARTCLLKPGMLIGRVVGNKVEDELEVTLVGLLQQGIQVLERPEERMDTGVVANIIAKIRHRGRIAGGEPDGITAKPTEVVQP